MSDSKHNPSLPRRPLGATDSLGESNIADASLELLQLIPSPALLADLKGRVLFSNKAASQWAVDEREWWNCFDADSERRIRQAIDALISFTGSSSFEPKVEGVVTQLGEVFDLSLSRYRAEDDRGELIAIAAQGVPAKVLVSELAVSTMDVDSLFDSGKYRSLVENLPLNVFHKDLEGRLTFVNKRYSEAIGMELESLVGKTDHDLFSSDLADKYRRDDQWVLQTGRPFHDIEFHPKGDENIYVELIKAPITDASGEVIGIQGMFWDVTDRKKGEAALRQAKEIAEAASKAKSDFLANVSHEIRTPMNGIIGMTELMLDTVKDKSDREHLELIQLSAESLLSLINNILDFSKIESGKIELESQRFNLRECIGDTVRALAFRAHEKDIELFIEVASNVPTEIVGDAVRLRQVIVNLVSNAIKFTEEGFVKVSVECEPVTRDDERVRDESRERLTLTVTDTGVGIPSDKQSKIFAEFEQADTSTTRKYGGTGLGLTIASRLVELMGGLLEVSSELDVGTLFYFSIDVAANRNEVAESNTGLVGRRGLIATRSIEVGENIGRQLLARGMATAVVCSASKAIAELIAADRQGEKFDLVVIENQLAEGDGMTVATMVRESDRFRFLPIVWLSNANMRDKVQCDPSLRIEHQLTKPVKERDLFLSVDAALEKASQEGTQFLKNESTEQRQRGVKTVVEIVIDDRPGSRPVRHDDQARKTLVILVAEDNKVNQRLIEELLRRVGHTVVMAETGVQAVEAFHSRAFDLVLMDVQMPEMDGFDATYEIRKLQAESGVRVPIIALTAHASPSDRKRCLAAGMDEYLAKPIRAAELYALIQSQTNLSFVDSMSGPGTTIELSRSGFAEASGNSDKRENVVDWEVAFDTVGGDQNLLTDLLKVFLKDHAGLLQVLKVAIKTNEAREVRLSAHSLRGALQHLGIGKAAGLMGEIEQIAADLIRRSECGDDECGDDECANDQGLRKASRLFDQVVGEVDAAVDEMKKFLGGSLH